MRCSLLLVLACLLTPVRGDDPVLLWPNGAPGAQGEEDADRPALWLYPVSEDASGAAVVICPGGGYRVHAVDHEGHQVARWFNRIGVSAFVLRYRLGTRYQHPAPLQDAQRALRWVRHRASKYSIDPQRIGIMGFSAGGHLASTLATHFDAGTRDATDPIDRLSCRPDFAILGYPVISLTADFSHRGSARALLGNEPDPALLQSLSNETQVTAQTPPAFLFHTSEDTAVPAENSLEFYRACLRAGVPAELHVYQEGPHGVGLADGHPVVSRWRERLHDWLWLNGFLADVDRAAVTGTVEYAGKPLAWGTIVFSPDDMDAPAAWAPVRGGRFSIPAHRGAVVGQVRVRIHDLGAVAPAPTIDDVRQLDADDLTATITAGENTFAFSLKKREGQ